jgi:hypothetical protein
MRKGCRYWQFYVSSRISQLEDSLIVRLLKMSGCLLALLSLMSCGPINAGIASLESTKDFHPLATDSRILAEPGGEELAKQVAGYLPEAIAVVEKEQYRQFSKPVEIYVCATEDSFASHTGLSKQVRGAIITKLFLSDRLSKPNFNETTRSILTHELSHLHLQQQLGIYHYNADIPAWFQEGLAVMVSGGGGAEKITDEDAAKAILEGKHFTPEPTGSFLFHKYANAYGLEPHMFYRQAFLFVNYLRLRSEAKFKLFLLSIEDGKNFEESFKNQLGTSIHDALQDFINQIQNKS